ncbi:MAG: PorV/PorQ family protein [Lentisphaeria bacterium]|nr:PorV/PorQ family protein [Candidatus Neomarinimicrobiota bacterium]MCF7843236.1 PorV/PorQ family protein [Lentisphaeria bacterium]
MKSLRIFAFGLLFAGVTLAQQSLQDSLNTVQPGQEFTKVATSVGQFLKLESGASGAGLAGAYTALAKGAAALAWNPAGIAFATGPDMYISSQQLYAGISNNYMGVVYPLGSSNYFGFSTQYMNSGDMEVTTLDFPDGTGEQFQVMDVAVGVTFTRKLTDRLAVGVTTKWIREQIYRETASVLAFDIGSNFNLGIYGLTLGMAIQNFGGSTRFDGPDLNQEVDINSTLQGNPEVTSRLLTEDWPLPLVFRMGLLSDVIGGKSPWMPSAIHRLTLVADANDASDTPLRGAVGFEYAWNDMIFFRGGYKFNYEWVSSYDKYRVEYNGEYDLGEYFVDSNGNSRWDWDDVNDNGVFDSDFDSYEDFTDGLRVKTGTVNRSAWESFYGDGKYPWRRISLGFGAKYNMYGTNLLFDYSYSNYGILGMVQQISLGLTF